MIAESDPFIHESVLRGLVLDKFQAIHYSFFIQRSIIPTASYPVVMFLTPADLAYPRPYR
jgi:hypothetical protein